MEVKPKAKASAKAASLRKQIMDEMGDKTVDQALAEAKHMLATADATIAEAAAMEEAQSQQAVSVQKEFELAKSNVEAAIQAETRATERYRLAKENRQQALSKIEEERRELLEAQKKVAMLEVLAVNGRKMRELEDKKKAAMEASETAKRNLMEQRQREKEELEATRKALDIVKMANKSARRKSMSSPGAIQESPAPKRASLTPGRVPEAELETLPMGGETQGVDVE